MGQQILRLNEKYKALYTAPCRYFILTGGRGSGKSFHEKLFEAQLSYEVGHKILSTRYYMNTAYDSVIPEFTSKLDLLNATSDFHVTKTDAINLVSKSEIKFRGVRTSSGLQTAKLKSLEGITTWVLDEAEEENSESNFDTIDKSVRVKGIQNRVILIMNPTTKEHWIYKRFFEEMGVRAGFTGIKDSVCYIHTDYRENKENLDPIVVREWDALAIKNPIKYNHQLLGGWRNKAEGVIFENYTTGKFDNSLPYIFGQDFGFSVDPTTLVKVAVDKKLKKLYVKSCYGKAGLSTSEIAAENKKYLDKELIIADSAEPRLINELRLNHQLNIKECEKGQGSITAGINLMLDYEIIVDDSPEIIKEFNNYVWNDKKSGVPIDDYNHYIDAIRYALKRLVKPKLKILA